MTYKPQPIETSAINLTDEINTLTELLAKNVHDTWAFQRISDGWKYGPFRNDTKKEHPCLVPYDELPEAEKQYDRNTAVQTIKAIIAMGYNIGR